MIEQALCDYLKQKVGIKKITPAFSTAPFPSVSYKYSAIKEGPVKEGEFEIRVVGDILDDVVELRNKIINVLQTNLNDPSITMNEYVLRAEVAGGGWMFDSDTQMWEYPTIFTITWRCKNGR